MNIYENIRTIDIETYDPALTELGPGVYNDTGAFVLGVGITNERKEYEYLPIGHTDVSKEERNRAKERLRVLCGDPCPKLIVNAQYDVDFIENMLNIPVKGFVHDIQLAEPLLDAYALSYDLDSLCRKYGVKPKFTVNIEAWADRIDPKRGKKPAQQYLWLMPCSVVAEYCEGDVFAPEQILRKQLVEMEAQGLLPLYEIECKLLRPLMRMRKNGIRVDEQRRQKAVIQVKKAEDALLTDIYGRYGTFNINSSAAVAKLLTAEGIKLPKTAGGADSVTKEVLEQNFGNSPLCEPLHRARQLNKLRTSFLEKSIPEHVCSDGRIHGQFYQLKKDDGGTVTGRFCGRNPNLQQVPRNDEELGSLIRGLFIPEENCWYGKTDYSQIEYRIFMHFARGYEKDDEADLMAQAVRQKFIDDPHTDYHQMVMDLAHVDRPTAKRINFGTMYFMGVASLSRKFSIPLQQAEALYDTLFKNCPFIVPTRQLVVDSAKRKGYVRTLLGRRQRVSEYHKQARKEYAMFNYLIQGSAADMMKKAMVDCEEAGIYDVLSLHLTVHDETGVSVPKTEEGIEAYREQEYLMSNAIKIRIPVLAEADYGVNWGEKRKLKKNDIFTNMLYELRGDSRVEGL